MTEKIRLAEKNIQIGLMPKKHTKEEIDSAMKTFSEQVADAFGIEASVINGAVDKREIGKHYGYDYKGIRLDPYRIFSVYRIGDPCQQHAIKKLLRAGESVKSLDDDIAEAIATLQRWQQMRAEDEA